MPPPAKNRHCEPLRSTIHLRDETAPAALECVAMTRNDDLEGGLPLHPIALEADMAAGHVWTARWMQGLN